VLYLLRRLRDLHVVDAAREQALVREGILTADDLDRAIAENRPAVRDDALRRAASSLADDRHAITLGRAWDVLDTLVPALNHHCPDLLALEPAGAVRRAAPIVPGIVLVACADAPHDAAARIAALPVLTEVLHRTERRLLILFEGHEIDIRVAAPDEFGSVLFAETGPVSHVVDVQKRRGPRICASEMEVYSQAGLAWLPPETRESPDAIERAAAGPLPPLVHHTDIRGDLHMHTTYSDGRDSLRTMVTTAAALGYEYIAITDHSEHAGAGRTVDAARLAKQRDEIEQVRGEMTTMAIFHGLEVDILEDGRLDADDDTMASLDIVLASLHESHGHDGRRLTRRCLAAIEHPLVSVISHPANQLVGRREGYDLDYGALYEAAARTGTALEIDGAPAHLDLDGDHARAAVAAGVTVAIDSDCHRARSLNRQMLMGIGTARRGWVERQHVLNARPLGEIRAFIAAKRSRPRTP
jgi:DNA polymerase (family 10)